MMSKKIFICLVTIFFNLNLFSQTRTLDYSSQPKEYEIADLSVSGVNFYSTDLLVQLSGLTIGQKISIPGDKITQAIEKLWKQNLFSNVQISAVKFVENKVYLNIYLQERPKISELKFTGVKKSDQETLLEAIKLVRGSQVTDQTLINTKNIIKKHYIEKGFYKTKVDIIMKNDSLLQNAVILNITIDKQKKTKIKEIDPEGNTVFTDKQIRRAMKDTKKKRWYGLFKPSKFIENTYDEDKNKIIEKYNQAGYRDAKIVSDSIFDCENNLLGIKIKIHEGKKYFFRNITWVGNTKYTARDLSDVLGIKKGDIFDQKHLEERTSIDETAVGNLYMDNGYLFYNLSPREVTVENDSIDLEMVIYEGKQATIKNIIINGNTKTNEHVVRRELRTLPGELFRKTDVIRTIRELAQLGNFDQEKIVPTPIPNSEDGTVDIQYSLVEKPNDQIELSGGWGANMLVGTLGVSFNNFSTRNIFNKESWQPLPVGDGQRFSVRAQTNGTRYQSYNMSFVEPWLGGKKPNSFTFSLYHTIQTNGLSKGDVNRTSMTVNGAAIGFGTRLKWPDDYFTLYHELSIQSYNLNRWAAFNFLSDGTANNLSYKIAFSRNSLDAPIYTRSGSSLALTLQVTPPYSLFRGNVDYSKQPNSQKYKWIEFHKWSFSGDIFNRIVGDLVMHVKAQYGFIGYYTKSLGHSPLENYSLGGDGMGYNTYGTDVVGLRGYENDALTPGYGGNIYDKFTFEIRYPLTLSESAQIYALTFMEGGNCWNKFDNLNPFNLYRSAGVGVRIMLPMLGLIGIDWGYGFDNIPGKSGANHSQFHFILGQPF